VLDAIAPNSGFPFDCGAISICHLRGRWEEQGSPHAQLKFNKSKISPNDVVPGTKCPVNRYRTGADSGPATVSLFQSLERGGTIHFPVSLRILRFLP
jgi:hypothetical protein